MDEIAEAGQLALSILTDPLLVRQQDTATLMAWRDLLTTGEADAGAYADEVRQALVRVTAVLAFRGALPVGDVPTPATTPIARHDDGVPPLGPCCSCGALEQVRTLIMVEKRGPVPGTGWGCLVCDLPADGALAVQCDRCVAEGAPLREVCVGHVAAAPFARVPLITLDPAPFTHDLARHMFEAGPPLTPTA